MKLPTLYKRAVTGALLEWTVEIEENKHRTLSGQVGGAITATEWTACECKNEGRANATTAEEQAVKDAQSKWTKKQDREQYVQDKTKVDQKKFVQPMLAQNFKDRVDTPAFQQALKTGNVSANLKLNGARCVASKDGLLSRKGSEWKSCPHILTALQPVFEEFPDLVLDGELFNDSLRQDLGSIISLISKKKLTDNDFQKSAEVVEYHVYDIVDTDQTYYERHDRLKELVAKLNHPQIKFVERIPVSNVKQIDDLLLDFEMEGHEGLIVRVNEVYENKRSKNLLKHKSFTDDEFLIVGAEEGFGNLSGKIGAFILEDARGVRFNSSPTGSHEYWEELWKNRASLVGKYATVKYKELSPVTERGGGVPSFGKVVAIRDYEG